MDSPPVAGARPVSFWGIGREAAALGGAVVLAILAVLVVAPSASALPFYGFNSVALPCQTGEETTARCIDSTEFSWHGGKPFVYRFAVSKRCVDPQDSGYSDGGDWRRYDNAVDRLRSSNGEPFMVIQWAPAASSCGTWRLPGNNYEYNQFYWWVRNLVRHYRSRGVQDYEVWNEPNLRAFTGGYNVDPNQYAYTYCNAWWALRDEAIGSRLHLGGIADNGYYGAANTSRYALDIWLRDVNTKVRAYCPAARVSGVSTHWYWENACVDPQTGGSGALDACLSAQRYYINRYWGSDKLLMLTETGVGDDRFAWSGISTLNREEQRQNVASLLDTCNWAWTALNVRACYYYPIKEERTWPYCTGGNLTASLDGERSVYGLVRATCDINAGEPYPAWWEYYNRLR
ncbi:MAG TPA: hypothetical protein VF520_15045 [Thermoleophilaceae bacterium]